MGVIPGVSCAPPPNVFRLCAGIIADTLGLSWAIGFVGVLTFSSGTIVALFMREMPKGRG